MMRGLSIRARIATSYAAVLVLLLLGFGFLLTIQMQRYVESETRRELDEELAEFEHQAVEGTKLGEMVGRIESWFAFHKEYEFELASIDGERLTASRRLGTRRLLDQTPLPQPESGSMTRTLVGMGDYGIGWRTLHSLAPPVTLFVAVPLQERQRMLRQMVSAQLISGIVMVGAALTCAYLLACRTLAPVEQITKTAARITSLRLDERIEVQNPNDELGRLSRTFNSMIERLDRAFAEIRRFTADAAHELRTPLSVIRSDAEIALQSSRSEAEYRDTLKSMLEEVVRLCALVEQLLTMAREDAGALIQRREKVAIDQVVSEVTLRFGGVLESRHIHLTNAVPHAEVEGDRQQLIQLCVNLLDNAVKYTPEKGRIAIRGSVGNDVVHLLIEDTGPGIAPEHRDRVFERFYRVDSSRTASSGGTGLGLSICEAIVRAHRGEIRLECPPEGGTRVHVSLPVSQTPRRP